MLPSRKAWTLLLVNTSPRHTMPKMCGISPEHCLQTCLTSFQRRDRAVLCVVDARCCTMHNMKWVGTSFYLQCSFIVTRESREMRSRPREKQKIMCCQVGRLRNDDSLRRIGQRRLKMNLYFTYKPRHTLKSFSLFLTGKTIPKLNIEHSVKLEM